MVEYDFPFTLPLEKGKEQCYPTRLHSYLISEEFHGQSQIKADVACGFGGSIYLHVCLLSGQALFQKEVLQSKVHTNHTCNRL